MKIEINESECNLLRKRIQDAIPNQVIEKIILINANASDIIPLRKWPIKNFVKLSNLLLTDSTITIILTGSSNEYDKCENLLTEIGSGRTINFAGKTLVWQQYLKKKFILAYNFVKKGNI